MTHVRSSGSHCAISKRQALNVLQLKNQHLLPTLVLNTHGLSLLCRIQHRSASDTPWTLHIIAARKRCQASLGMSCLPWPITWGVGAVVTAQPTVGQLWTGSGTCAMTTQYTAAAIKRAPHSWPTCCSTGVWSRLQECCSVYVMHQAVELTAWVVFCIDSLTVGWT